MSLQSIYSKEVKTYLNTKNLYVDTYTRPYNKKMVQEKIGKEQINNIRIMWRYLKAILLNEEKSGLKLHFCDSACDG